MKFKIGDRVKFLDEHGGGVITKIVSHNLVHVAIEEGFEIPTLTNNLILAEDITRSINWSQGRSAEPAPVVLPPEEEQARDEALPRIRGRKEMPEGLYLVYVPQDQKWLVTGKFDLFLVNHTPWEVMFSLFLLDPETGYTGKDYDIVGPSSRIHLATLRAERLEHWSNGTAQFLFRKEATDRLLLPASIDFRIKGHRFLKEGSYLEYTFMDGKSFLVTLATLTTIGYTGKEPSKEVSAQVSQGKAAPPVPDELIHAYRKGELEAEVDLHIEALLEDHSDLGKHDLLSIQLGHFLACLESGMRSGYRKIIFIHGVGAGKLRQEIEQRLAEYDGLEWQDAPMRDYGQGALVVRIHGRGGL